MLETKIEVKEKVDCEAEGRSLSTHVTLARNSFFFGKLSGGTVIVNSQGIALHTFTCLREVSKSRRTGVAGTATQRRFATSHVRPS